MYTSHRETAPLPLPFHDPPDCSPSPISSANLPASFRPRSVQEGLPLPVKLPWGSSTSSSLTSLRLVSAMLSGIIYNHTYTSLA